MQVNEVYIGTSWTAMQLPACQIWKPVPVYKDLPDVRSSKSSHVTFVLHRNGRTVFLLFSLPLMMQYFFSLVASAGVAQAYTITVSEPFMQKNIDPIIFPGQYDKSHMHTFFGSDAVTVSTKTSAELQKGCSSTDNPNDLSIYCTLLSNLVRSDLD